VNCARATTPSERRASELVQVGDMLNKGALKLTVSLDANIETTMRMGT